MELLSLALESHARAGVRVTDQQFLKYSEQLRSKYINAAKDRARTKDADVPEDIREGEDDEMSVG